MNLKNQKILLLGLNRNGIAAFLALKKLGAHVFALDLSGHSKNREQAIRELHAFQSQISFGPLDKIQDFSRVVLSGAKNLYQAIIDSLPSTTQVLSTLDLASSCSEVSKIGITGTNGKSSVSKCLEEMLLAGGKRTFLGGGSFEPYASLLMKDKMEFAVLETSSVILEYTNHFKPHVAILTNLVPSHFERYETSHQYFRAKARLFENQTKEDYLIYDAENPYVEEWVTKALSQHFPAYFSNPKRYSKNIRNFSYYEKGQFYFSHEGNEIEIFSAQHIRSHGRHMLMNALQALTAAKLLGIESQKIQQVLDHFKGLPHRMEKIFEKNGLIFYNDARSSNPAATAWGLSRFEKPVILILGGLDQGADYKKLIPYIKQHVKLLIILGEGRRSIFAALKNHVDTYLVETLKESVHVAVSKSQKGDTIVFSPASAPEPHIYGGYSDRGERYKHSIEEEFENDPDLKMKNSILKSGLKV